jgi:hypothetical protein
MTNRREYWQRRLGRIRLDAEPIPEQLARYRRVTWVITGVAIGIAAIIVGLLSAFGAPLIGLGSVGVIFGPVILLAWFDFWRMARGARAFLAESERA